MFFDTVDTEVGKKQASNWRFIVACAVTQLESVCTNIHNGNITITELKSIRAKQTQMNKLCEVTTSKSELAELQKSITQRLTEFEYFDDYKTKLECILSHIGNILIGKITKILFFCM